MSTVREGYRLTINALITHPEATPAPFRFNDVRIVSITYIDPKGHVAHVTFDLHTGKFTSEALHDTVTLEQEAEAV